MFLRETPRPFKVASDYHNNDNDVQHLVTMLRGKRRINIIGTNMFSDQEHAIF